MPMDDDLYWNSIDFGSDESLHEPSKHYVDPWDLENYAYIRQHLNAMDDNNIIPSISEPYSSDEFTTEANSMSISYVPIRRQSHLKRDQNYADIEEIRHNDGNYYKRPSRRRQHNIYNGDSMGEFEENPYEVNMKDISIPYALAPKQDRWMRRMSMSNSRDRSRSFSYGDYYGTNQDIYCKLDEVRPRRDSTMPIYDDIRNNKRQPRNFGLSNYGHLKIDYSYNWNKLDKYILSG